MEIKKLEDLSLIEIKAEIFDENTKIQTSQAKIKILVTQLHKKLREEQDGIKKTN